MSRLFENLVRPFLFRLPPETAHEIGIDVLRLGLGLRSVQEFAANRFRMESFGETERFGLHFRNALGIAAGFDKNGVVVNQLAALGFGFVEVGTITYMPQAGNEKPRLFRLPDDCALINCLGFNNDGAARVVERLKGLKPNCVLGVNIGKNKTVANEEAVENYVKSFELAHQVADYIAVNISSPNTPNLRELQRAEYLEQLLAALQGKNEELGAKPLLVKIAPDLADSEIEAVVDICMQYGVSGIIATNTTIRRDGLKTSDPSRFGEGGLSGKPLAGRSNEVISTIFQYSQGKMPVIGVGGIFTASDAFDKIAAGACLLQAYTGFIYRGPAFARDINRGLAAILREKGFVSIDEAVGFEAVPKAGKP